MNIPSIVLRLEYEAPEAMIPGAIIFGGVAQIPSWSKVLEEYPNFVKTQNPEQRIQVTEAFNPLNCSVLKVSHHGSKHGTVLECAEVLNPEYALVSCSGSSAYGFPHEIALLSLKEETDRMYFTDYSVAGKARSGTTVVVSPGTEPPGVVSIGEERGAMASPP